MNDEYNTMIEQNPDDIIEEREPTPIRYFAAIDNGCLVGYYNTVFHKIENIPISNIEITEDLWKLLTTTSMAKQFITVPGQYKDLYDVEDFVLFEEVPMVEDIIEPTDQEKEMQRLKAELEMTQSALNDIIMIMMGGE